MEKRGHGGGGWKYRYLEGEEKRRER